MYGERGMAQGAGHFVGRADELGVLSGLVAGLDRGRPGALGLTGEPAVVDSYPLLGYSLVQTIARGVEIAGTTDGEKLAKALETFEDEPLLAGPTTYTESCHVPVQRSLLIIRYEDGKPRSTGDFVRPEKVPPYPC
jgi:hypothetical protein